MPDSRDIFFDIRYGYSEAYPLTKMSMDAGEIIRGPSRLGTTLGGAGIGGLLGIGGGLLAKAGRKGGSAGALAGAAIGSLIGRKFGNVLTQHSPDTSTTGQKLLEAGRILAPAALMGAATYGLHSEDDWGGAAESSGSQE